jgi:hypothetical protein
MHIVSASRRTDIPAFHAEWFMNRIRAGRVGVRAPFGGRQYEVSLARDDVIAIVFWTKNAAPLIPYLGELRERGYPFMFLYTINNYPESLESNVPPLSHSVGVLEEIVVKQAAPVVWRYDTIVLGGDMTTQWHVDNFGALCQCLSPYVDTCIFSFCDYYKKTRKNMARFFSDYLEPSQEESSALAEELALKARARGITLASCAHDVYVSDAIVKARCVDSRLIDAIVPAPEKKAALAALKRQPTRKGCGCLASRDIGAYDTCLHGCAYCYANSNVEAAAKRVALIEPDAFSLEPGFRE